MLGKKGATAQSSSGTPRWRRRAVRYALVLIGSVLVIDALVGERGLLATIQARRQYRSLEQSLADARAENARMREQARRLREEPDAIEELARRELGLIKPGERLFIVRDIGPADSR